MDFEELLLLLADIYTGLRTAEASSAGPAFLRGGVRSTEFRRNVTKYWINASARAILVRDDDDLVALPEEALRELVDVVLDTAHGRIEEVTDHRYRVDRRHRETEDRAIVRSSRARGWRPQAEHVCMQS